jgi:hypothetical protein
VSCCGLCSCTCSRRSTFALICLWDRWSAGLHWQRNCFVSWLLLSCNGCRSSWRQNCWIAFVLIFGAGIDTGYSYRNRTHGMTRYKTKNDWGMACRGVCSRYAHTGCIPCGLARGVAVSHTGHRPHGVITVLHTADRSHVYRIGYCYCKAANSWYVSTGDGWPMLLHSCSVPKALPWHTGCVLSQQLHALQWAGWLAYNATPLMQIKVTD